MKCLLLLLVMTELCWHRTTGDCLHIYNKQETEGVMQKRTLDAPREIEEYFQSALEASSKHPFVFFLYFPWGLFKAIARDDRGQGIIVAEALFHSASSLSSPFDTNASPYSLPSEILVWEVVGWFPDRLQFPVFTEWYDRESRELRAPHGLAQGAPKTQGALFRITGGQVEYGTIQPGSFIRQCPPLCLRSFFLKEEIADSSAAAACQKALVSGHKLWEFSCWNSSDFQASTNEL